MSHWRTGVKDRRTFSHFVLLSRLMPSQVGKEIPTTVFWNITERNCGITGAKKCKLLIKCWSGSFPFLFPNGHLTLYRLRYCPSSISSVPTQWRLTLEACSCPSYSSPIITQLLLAPPLDNYFKSEAGYKLWESFWIVCNTWDTGKTLLSSLVSVSKLWMSVPSVPFHV